MRRRLGVLREERAVRAAYSELLTRRLGRSCADDWERGGARAGAGRHRRVARPPERAPAASSTPSPAGTSCTSYLPMVEAAERARRGRRHAALPRRHRPPDQAARRAAARRRPRDGDQHGEPPGRGRGARRRSSSCWPTRRACSSSPCSRNSSLSVGDLVEELKLSQPTISVHVRQLREAGLLEVPARRRADALLDVDAARRGACSTRRGSVLRSDLRVRDVGAAASVVEAANSTRFARDHGLASPAELLRRSIEEPAWFWDAWARYLPLAFDEPYDVVLDESRGPEWARWFTGGRLNLASRAACTATRAASAPAGSPWWPRTSRHRRAAGPTPSCADVARAADGLAALGVRRATASRSCHADVLRGRDGVLRDRPPRRRLRADLLGLLGLGHRLARWSTRRSCAS